MSENVRIIFAMIGGLFCGVSLTLAIWAMTLARKAMREAREFERAQRTKAYREAIESNYKSALRASP